MAYLLDSDVFIQAKNLHYGFDFCPAFWAWLEQENAGGRVFSIERVHEELVAGEDELAGWAGQRGSGFFLAPTQDLLEAFREVSAWVSGAGFDSGAVNTFLSVADAWLVADALSRGWVVVTHERPADTVKKVKLPNACIALGVKVMSPFAMLRVEHARFVLGPGHSRGRGDGR